MGHGFDKKGRRFGKKAKAAGRSVARRSKKV